ncbi:MAG: GDP-mannose 4,6-dehydratase [Chitinophagaceae bacterium]
MKVVITGGCGFLGSNIAQAILKRGDDLFIIDNLSRLGSDKNYEWLQSIGAFRLFQTDIRNTNDIASIIKDHQPNVIYHLAGQVAMTTSLADPRLDFEINVLGTINVLEAVRNFSPHSIVVYSSTNKVYGDLEWAEYEEKTTRYEAKDFPNGFSEATQLDFHSPYGVSKGSADQYCLDYARMFGLNTVVFRHSSMFGGRQFSTYDQGWIGWFCSQALLQKQNRDTPPFTISGDGKQVRDVLYASDMVELYLQSAAHITKTRGNAFNIGGGMNNSLSLLELFRVLEGMLGIEIRYEKIAPRVSDQKVFVADLTKINSRIGWQPKVTAEEGIGYMLNWLGKGENK